MAMTGTERMRAHRARRRRRVRRLTVEVSEDDLHALRSAATRAPQAATRAADPRLSLFSFVTLLPVSTAPAETVLQRAVVPSHRRCGATHCTVTGP